MTKNINDYNQEQPGGLYIDNFVMYKLIMVDLNVGNEWQILRYEGRLFHSSADLIKNDFL